MSLTKEKQLLDAARNAARHAYAPYSQYRVGAAVITKSGDIFTGCNVENASYGLTICAERVAVFGAFAAGHRVIHAVAIYAPQPPAPLPCGACRQVLSENGNRPEIIVIAHDNSIRRFSLEEMLPYSFDLSS